MGRIAWVDTLRAVPKEKVDTALEAGNLLKDWAALLFGSAGINGGFVHDDVSLLEYCANKRRRLEDVAQVGLFRSIYGRWHRDDVKVAVSQVVQRICKGNRAVMQRLLIDLSSAIVAVLELYQSLRANIVSNTRANAAELDCNR